MEGLHYPGQQRPRPTLATAFSSMQCNQPQPDQEATGWACLGQQRQGVAGESPSKRKPSRPLSAQGSLDHDGLRPSGGLHASKKRCCTTTNLALLDASGSTEGPLPLPLAAALPLPGGRVPASASQPLSMPGDPYVGGWGSSVFDAAWQQQQQQQQQQHHYQHPAGGQGRWAPSNPPSDPFHYLPPDQPPHAPYQQPPQQHVSRGLPPRHPRHPSGAPGAPPGAPQMQAHFAFAGGYGGGYPAEAHLQPQRGVGVGLAGLLPQQQPTPHPSPASAWPSPQHQFLPSSGGSGSSGSAFAAVGSPEDAWGMGSLECDESLSDLDLDVEEDGFFSAASHTSLHTAPHSDDGPAGASGYLNVRPSGTLGGYNFPEQAADMAMGSPFLDMGHLVAPSAGFQSAAMPAAAATVPAAPAPAPPQYPQHPPFSSTELREANASLARLLSPEGIEFIPVHEQDCLIPMVTQFGIPPVSIALGASYFQRLIMKSKDMQDSILASGFLVHVPTSAHSVLTGKPAPRLLMMRACPRIGNETMLALYCTCIYLGAKVGDRIQYRELLSRMLSLLFDRDVDGQQAADLELTILKELDWRLGPVFNCGPEDGPY